MKMFLAAWALAAGILSHAADAADSPQRNIHEWAKCDGKTDDTASFAKAIDAAKQRAFDLIVDCKIRLSIGSDIEKPIFIDDGTTVTFRDGGELLVDNDMIPAFVLLDASDVKLTNWKLSYIGQLPADPTAASYVMDGKTVAAGGGRFISASHFNDHVLTEWAKSRRKINFEQAKSKKWPWAGPTNMSAIFYITGDTHGVEISGLTASVPEGSDASHFIPVLIQSSLGIKTGASPKGGVDEDPSSYAIPSGIVIDKLTLDGYYMGIVGSFRSSSFSNINAFRYGDLQDGRGQNVGGTGKWFAPPHLFYLTSGTGTGNLRNESLHLLNVTDHGKRLGTARDLTKDKLSGYANSLKIGADNSDVRHYRSYRPDGVADILPSHGLHIVDLVGVYNSTFTHGIYPGVRFPGSGYAGITLEDVTIVDKSCAPAQPAVAMPRAPDDKGISLEKVATDYVGQPAAKARVTAATGVSKPQLQNLGVATGCEN